MTPTVEGLRGEVIYTQTPPRNARCPVCGIVRLETTSPAGGKIMLCRPAAPLSFSFFFDFVLQENSPVRDHCCVSTPSFPPSEKLCKMAGRGALNPQSPAASPD